MKYQNGKKKPIKPSNFTNDPKITNDPIEFN